MQILDVKCELTETRPSFTKQLYHICLFLVCVFMVVDFQSHFITCKQRSLTNLSGHMLVTSH